MSARWCRKQLTHGLSFLARLQKKGKENPSLERNLILLDQALLSSNLLQAESAAERVASQIKKKPSSSWSWKIFETVFTIAIAIFIAAVVRQTWFELYEIPTGSMRPTFKEQDRVLVSKSAFGLNMPFQTKHLLFSESRVKRGNITVITADKLDLPDVDTLYFGLFPGKKRYVKRCAALPNDWVYFYGGDLYVVGENADTIERLRAIPELEKREFIPFISSFEGRVQTQSPSSFSRKKSFLLKHMNTPIGKVELRADSTLSSSIANKDLWSPEFSSEIPKNRPRTLGEFWGIKNFAMCRLLIPEQLPKKAQALGFSNSEALCWLELHHSPTLPDGRIKRPSLPLVNLCTTWIPFYKEHIDRIRSALYTARITIKEGRAHRYHFENLSGKGVPLPTEIPDGCFEFYHGKALQIGWGGSASELDKTHPIYPKNLKQLCFWFNAGIDLSLDALSPSSPHLPTRFAYFQHGDLCLMGQPIITKEDPILSWFENMELSRQARDYSYFAFQDAGPPESVEYIKNFGYKVPDNHYLLFGDNPVMSVDSRFFGPVPQENIEGTPILLFWPFGNRSGRPTQPHQLISIYSCTILLLVGIATTLYFRHHRRKRKQLLHELRKKHRN